MCIFVWGVDEDTNVEKIIDIIINYYYFLQAYHECSRLDEEKKRTFFTHKWQNIQYSVSQSVLGPFNST